MSKKNLELELNRLNEDLSLRNDQIDNLKSLLRDHEINREDHKRILTEAQHEIEHLTQTIRSLHYSMNLMQGEIKKLQILIKLRKDSLAV